MGVAPGLPEDTTRRLQELNPHFTPKWNRLRDNWEIWFVNSPRRPYIVAIVQYADGSFMPIDVRTYNYLRKTIYNNRNIVRHLYEIIEADRYAEVASTKAEYDKFYDISMEHRREAQMFSREMGVTSGKTKIPVGCGWGNGK